MKHKLLRMITKKTEKYTQVQRHKEMLISLLFLRKKHATESHQAEKAFHFFGIPTGW